MALFDTVLKIIGSKWFSLAVAIGLAAAIPTTWHNVVVYRVWWTMGVFACNLGGIGLAAYKFMGSFGKKDSAPKNEEW